MSQDLGADEQQDGQGSKQVHLRDGDHSRDLETDHESTNRGNDIRGHGRTRWHTTVSTLRRLVDSWRVKNCVNNFQIVNPGSLVSRVRVRRQELLSLSDCAIVWRAAWRFHRLYTRAWKHLFSKEGILHGFCARIGPGIARENSEISRGINIY